MGATGGTDVLGYRMAQSADLVILDVAMPVLAPAVSQRDFLAVNSGSPHPRYLALEYTERCRTNLDSCMQVA